MVGIGEYVEKIFNSSVNLYSLNSFGGTKNLARISIFVVCTNLAPLSDQIFIAFIPDIFGIIFGSCSGSLHGDLLADFVVSEAFCPEVINKLLFFSSHLSKARDGFKLFWVEGIAGAN